MSSYPPPSPPAGGPYPPYDRFARAQQKAQQQAIRTQQRAQQAAMKAQFRAQQAAARMQRRSMRRSSIVGPLLLLGLGLLFLMVSLGRISWQYSLDWFGRWWPAVLILAGIVLLVEWTLDQRRSNETGVTRSLGGGVIALLIFIAILGAMGHAASRGLAWKNEHVGQGFSGLDEVLGNRRDAYSDLSSPITAGEVLVLNCPHGDVEVTGSSTDGQVHVSVHKQTYGWNERDAEKMGEKLQPTFSSEGKVLTLSAGDARGGRVDLTVTVPVATAVTVNSDHGDVQLSDLKAAVTLSANHGDVTVNEVEGDVQATVNDDDADVKLSGVHGALVLNGHTGDVDITELYGPLTMHGDFYGTTHLQHITGAVSFDTSRTHFAAQRLDDEFSVEKDSLDASGLLGPVVLKTQDKNITLERVQGNVDVTNSNGDVNVTNAAPAATINIMNHHGSVDLGLPAAAIFVLDAQTKNGDMENDFGLTATEDADNHALRGSVGAHGGKITVATSDGDVTVRKSSVAPLPPAPPQPPAPPVPPTVPKLPGVPKVPSVPQAPKSYTF